MNEDELPERMSRSAEDYLEAIGLLCDKSPSGQAQVSEVAQMLRVKKPSVTAAMRQLAEEGMINYRPYAPIQLTTKGRAYADGVIRAHRILHRFMIEAAGLSPERAEAVGCLIEHILTYEEILGIEQRLNARAFER